MELTRTDAAHFTVVSLLHAPLAWLCPKNITGPGMEQQQMIHCVILG